PMTATDRVATIAIFNEKNPERGVAVFSLGPRAGKASVSTHIRLAASQKLTAIARTDDGAFWSATVDVVVTLAACIAGDNPVQRESHGSCADQGAAVAQTRRDDRDSCADCASDGNGLPAGCGGSQAPARHPAALLVSLQRGARHQRGASPGNCRQPVFC